MRILFINLFFLMIFSWAYAQDSIPMVMAVEPASKVPHVLIVPMNSKMYASDADAYILKESELSFNQMVGSFRAGMCQAVKAAMPAWWTSTILKDPGDTLQLDELLEISFKYELQLLQDESGSQKKGLFGKKKMKTHKSGIQNGQLKIIPDHRLKFMDITILNDTILHYLGKNYGASFFFFINQLDIRSDLSDHLEVGKDNYIRKIRMHYTLMDLRGKKYYSGLSESVFPSTENRVKYIMETYFTQAAMNATSNMPPPIKPKKARQKKEEK